MASLRVPGWSEPFKREWNPPGNSSQYPYTSVLSGNSHTPTLPGQPSPWHDPHQQLHRKPQHELSRSCVSRTTTAAAAAAAAAATSISTAAVSAAAALSAARASCNGPAASLSAASCLPCNARLRSCHGRPFHVRQHGDACVFLSTVTGATKGRRSRGRNHLRLNPCRLRASAHWRRR